MGREVVKPSRSTLKPRTRAKTRSAFMFECLPCDGPIPTVL